MLSQLTGAGAEAAKVGQRVALRCGSVGKFILPFFELAQSGPPQDPGDFARLPVDE